MEAAVKDQITYSHSVLQEFYSSVGLKIDEINLNPAKEKQIIQEKLFEKLPNCQNEFSIRMIDRNTISISNVIYKRVPAEDIHVLRELLLRCFTIHRNIIHIHSKLILDKHYVAQEDFQYTLREFRYLKKYNWIAMLIGLCDALIYLHSKGIFTSNLNPDTLVVDSNKNILISELLPVSQTQVKYMAPEQLYLIDRSTESDAWTIGCILVFLFTGNDPFYGLPESEEEFKYLILDKSHLKRVIEQEELKPVRKLLAKIFKYKRSHRASLLDIFKYLRKLA